MLKEMSAAILELTNRKNRMNIYYACSAYKKNSNLTRRQLKHIW